MGKALITVGVSQSRINNDALSGLISGLIPVPWAIFRFLIKNGYPLSEFLRQFKDIRVHQFIKAYTMA